MLAVRQTGIPHVVMSVIEIDSEFPRRFSSYLSRIWHCMDGLLAGAVVNRKGPNAYYATVEEYMSSLVVDTRGLVAGMAVELHQSEDHNEEMDFDNPLGIQVGEVHFAEGTVHAAEDSILGFQTVGRELGGNTLGDADYSHEVPMMDRTDDLEGADMGLAEVADSFGPGGTAGTAVHAVVEMDTLVHLDSGRLEDRSDCATIAFHEVDRHFPLRGGLGARNVVQAHSCLLVSLYM